MYKIRKTIYVLITSTRSNIPQVVAFSRKRMYMSISGLVLHKWSLFLTCLLPFARGWNFSFSLLVTWHLNGNESSLLEPEDSNSSGKISPRSYFSCFIVNGLHYSEEPLNLKSFKYLFLLQKMYTMDFWAAKIPYWIALLFSVISF